MASKKVNALEGEMEQLKGDIEERYSGLAGRFSSMEDHFGSVEDRFARMEEMMRRMMETQTKEPQAFPSGDQKGKDARLEEDEVESVHPHDIPPRRPTEGGYGLMAGEQ